MKPCLLLFGVLAMCMMAAAQSQPPAQDERPLGDVARDAKAKAPATKARMVVDSDSIRASKLPIPDIRMDGDNSEEIVKAIVAYSSSHTPKETEDMVHSWYDRQDGTAQEAAEENRKANERQQDAYYDQPTDIKDYQKYMQEQRLKQMSARLDSRRIAENYKIVNRTAQTMQMVKYKLQSNRIAYDWMRVRYSYEY